MGDENISAKFCGEFSDAAKLDKVLVFLAEHHVEEMPAVFSKELGPEVTRESFHLLAIRNAADIVEYLIKIWHGCCVQKPNIGIVAGAWAEVVPHKRTWEKRLKNCDL